MAAQKQIRVIKGEPADVVELRAHFGKLMSCQILHDSFYDRRGWVEVYIIVQGNEVAGYGSIVRSGPWKENRTVFEFFISPSFQRYAVPFFEAFLETANPVGIRAQSNDPMLFPLLHAFASNIKTEKILFEDQDSFSQNKHLLSSKIGDRNCHLFEIDDSHRAFSLVVDEAEVGKGGVMDHYNDPYVDLYMEIHQPFRGRGFASLLLRMLKEKCYEENQRPCARCNPENIPSFRSLCSAGLVPCGILQEGLWHR